VKRRNDEIWRRIVVIDGAESSDGMESGSVMVVRESRQSFRVVIITAILRTARGAQPLDDITEQSRRDRDGSSEKPDEGMQGGSL